MLLSPEFLLQLLQRFIKSSIQIKQIHSLLITNGDLLSIRSPSTFKWTTTLLYNALIRAYLNIHLPRTTLILFTHMLSHNIPPNPYTFPSLAKAAAAITPSLIAKPLYTQAFKRGVLADPFVQTSFINLFSQSGHLSCALNLFDEMPEPCIVSCNAMLDGFCKNGDMDSAVSFFKRMPKRDVYSWTTIVNGYTKKGSHETAIRFFQMCVRDCSVKPNEATYVSVLSSCANSDMIGGLLYGKQIHAYIIKNQDEITSFIGTSLISLYGKTGRLQYATKVFQSLTKKEICTWNAMIGALASHGKENQALEMFEKMKIDTCHPNEVTFVAILAACARAKLVEQGLEYFQSMLPEFGIVPKMEHYGCVVDLLGRLGFLLEAKDFINRMPFEPDASVLGALLGACRLHGNIDIGNDVAKSLLELEPWQCGQHILLSSIHADVANWEYATSLRNVMVGVGVEKLRGYSMVNWM
ncbi:hypothetical protein LXL04_009880 [Taraxacum kok-saghyz]